MKSFCTLDFKSWQTFGAKAARSDSKQPYTKVHGNATAQERPYHRSWSLHKQLPMVSHPHPKPWSHSSGPGKRETVEAEDFSLKFCEFLLRIPSISPGLKRISIDFQSIFMNLASCFGRGRTSSTACGSRTWVSVAAPRRN